MHETDASSWISALSVAPEDVIGPACGPDTIDRLRALVGPGAVDWAVKMASEASQPPLVDSPDLREGRLLTSVQRLGAESGFLSIIESLYRGRLATPLVTADGVRYIDDLIERRVPLSQLLAQVRRGQSFISVRLMDACRGLVAPSDLFDQLQLISRTLFEYADAVVAEVGPAFEAAERTWAASFHASRSVLLEQLLAGEVTDLEEISRRLGYEIPRRYHVAIVAHAENGKAQPGALERAALAALAEIGVSHTLLIPRGLSTVWAWGSSPAPVDVWPLAAWRDPDLAIGDAMWGLAGFRSSHVQAREAHRLSQLRAEPSTHAALFTDLSLMSLLASDPDRARDFVARELGHLTSGGKKTADLRRTLLVFLETRNLNTTATQLHIARNTVTDRLRRATMVLGRSVHERPLETWAALVLHEYLGDPGRVSSESVW